MSRLGHRREVIEALEAAPRTVGELARRVGCSDRSARQVVKTLFELGVVRRVVVTGDRVNGRPPYRYEMAA